MILKYSDLKGRTDLVGRKIRVPFGSCFSGEVGSEFTIVEVNNHNFTAENVGTRKWASTDISADCCIVELLDEEPAMGAKDYKDIVCRCGKKEDTRTEITWDNATMDDHVYQDYIILQYTDGHTAKVGPFNNYTFSIREYMRKSNLLIVQPNDKLIKMTLSQIEEKLGFKIEIV